MSREQVSYYLKWAGALLIALAFVIWMVGAESRDAEYKQHRLEQLGFHDISLSRMWSVRANVVTPDRSQRCTVYFDGDIVYYEGCWNVAQEPPR